LGSKPAIYVSSPPLICLAVIINKFIVILTYIKVPTSTDIWGFSLRRCLMTIHGCDVCGFDMLPMVVFLSAFVFRIWKLLHVKSTDLRKEPDCQIALKFVLPRGTGKTVPFPREPFVEVVAVASWLLYIDSQRSMTSSSACAIQLRYYSQLLLKIFHLCSGLSTTAADL
jgi:hypothetical protein